MTESAGSGHAFAGTGGSYKPGEHPAVVVVDVPAALADSTDPVDTDLAGPVAHTRAVCAAARAAGVPVVVAARVGASAFAGTGLAATLAHERVETLILCGALASDCGATAIDAMRHGYRSIVPRECLADDPRSPHEADLVDIDATPADVVRVGLVLAYLARLQGQRTSAPTLADQSA